MPPCLVLLLLLDVKLYGDDNLKTLFSNGIGAREGWGWMVVVVVVPGLSNEAVMTSRLCWRS